MVEMREAKGAAEWKVELTLASTHTHTHTPALQGEQDI